MRIWPGIWKVNKSIKTISSFTRGKDTPLVDIKPSCLKRETMNLYH